MPFLLLLLLTPPCLQESWPEPDFGMGMAPGRSAALTWTGMAGMVIVAVLWAWWVRCQLTADPGLRDQWAQRYGSWRMFHLFGMLGVYCVSLYVFGWGWAVQETLHHIFPEWSGLPPGAELIILAPFLIALLLSWVCFYEIERAMHDAAGPREGERYWTRWEHLGYQVRHNLALVFLPVALLIFLKGLRWLAVGTEPIWGYLVSGVTILALVLFFIGMPLLLRLVLGLKPMPDGPLRQRLLDAAKRLNFRCSNILLWSTRGGVANALVTGIIPVLRYVVLTDRLVTELTPEEVEAVFGHEVGHIKHRHMQYYLVFVLASMAAVWMVAAVYILPHLESLPTLSNRDDLIMLGAVALLGLYLFVVFGFVSRNCERQADIYGCRAVSCTRPDCEEHNNPGSRAPGADGLCPTGIRTFISALEKVADLNGISRDRPGLLQSWQHSTIARRVGFLQRVRVEPRVERRFQYAITVLKWLLLASLVAVIVIVGRLNGWDKLQ